MKNTSLFHVKHRALFFFFSFYCITGYSQGSISLKAKKITYTIPEDSSLKKLLSQNPDYCSLGQEEKELLYYLNYSRKNPAMFLDKAINVFISAHPEVQSFYSSSLQDTFKKLSALPIIYPDSMLSIVAKAHANDLKTHNTISHKSTNGKSFSERVGPYTSGCAAECIHAAQKFSSLEAVLFLLFDFNVPSLGHRRAILDKKFAKTGVGIALNSSGNSIAVIDFSCQ